MIRTITCIECPNGCQVSVTLNDGKVEKIEGNLCKKGYIYAENEITCPRRIITSTVKTSDGGVLPVKTDKPVKKDEMFEVMKKINAVIVTSSKQIGDVIVASITEDINLIATDNKSI